MNNWRTRKYGIGRQIGTKFKRTKQTMPSDPIIISNALPLKGGYRLPTGYRIVTHKEIDRTGYVQWHYHVFHPNHSQTNIMDTLEIYLDGIGAKSIRTTFFSSYWQLRLPHISVREAILEINQDGHLQISKPNYVVGILTRQKLINIFCAEDMKGYRGGF